jgi:hypothetical protein
VWPATLVTLYFDGKVLGYYEAAMAELFRVPQSDSLTLIDH